MSADAPVDESDLPPALAYAKAVGVDVERLVVDLLGLEPAADVDAHHDARTAALLAPDTVDASVPVIFAGTPLVAVDELVEVKACKRRISNGSHPVAGRWNFKGRDDGQHRHLVDAGAYYALAVYDEIDGRDSRELLALVIAPATVVDDELVGRWHDVDRSEGTMSRLPWSLSSLRDIVEADGGAE